MGLVTDLTLAGVSVSTLIVMVIEFAKLFKGELITKHAPLIAIVLGEVFSFMSYFELHTQSITATIIGGFTIGIQASGMYSASIAKAKMEKKLAEQEISKIKAQAVQIHTMALEKIQIINLSTLEHKIA